MPLFGIDCSSFQGNVSWAREHTAGLTWGCEKATQGVDYTNPWWTTSLFGMRSALDVEGGYHFLDTTGSGGQQADHFIRTVHDAHVFLTCDVETFGLDSRTVVDWFVEVARLTPGGPDLVCYTGRDLWSLCTGGLDIRTVEDRIGRRVWLWDCGDGHRPNVYVPARGPVAEQWAAVQLAGWQPYGGWTPATRRFLQFTDHASEPGVAGPVDGDVFLGTRADLRALTGIHPVPAPHPTPAHPGPSRPAPAHPAPAAPTAPHPAPTATEEDPVILYYDPAKAAPQDSYLEAGIGRRHVSKVRATAVEAAGGRVVFVPLPATDRFWQLPAVP